MRGARRPTAAPEPLVRAPSTRRRPAAAPEPAAAPFLDGGAAGLKVTEPASGRWRRRGSQKVDSAWWKLRSMAKVPRFLQQPYVLSGYRRKLSAWECVRSCFMLHNELISIWSHLIGAILFVVLAVRIGYAGSLALPDLGPQISDTLTPSALHELFSSAPGPIADCLRREETTTADCLLQVKEWAFAPPEPVAGLALGARDWNERVASAVPRTAGLRRARDGGLQAAQERGRQVYAGVSEGVRRLVQDAGEQFQAVAEKVGERALPLTCASNSTADWKRCIPLLERLESAMLTAGGELHKMSDRLQSTIICGERQCFNLTAAASADEQVRELIQQAQAAAQQLFTEALAKAALQTQFARDAVRADLSALRGQIAAYKDEGAEQLASVRSEGALAAHTLRTAVGRLLNNATKTLQAVGARVRHSTPGWEEVRTGWAKGLVEALGEAEAQISAAPSSVWPLVLYCCSATVCLLLSAVYHCFGTAMSRDMHDLFARLDFAGITTLISGSCFPIIYYTFYCRPVLQQRYLLLVSGCGLPLMFCCATKWYMAPEYSSLRVFNFLMLGAVGGVAFAHGVYLESQLAAPGMAEWELEAAAQARGQILAFCASVATMVGTYLAGTVLYVTHFPESVRPGRFDRCCSSHQLWHMCVIGAAMILWTGLREYAGFRAASTCPT